MRIIQFNVKPDEHVVVTDEVFSELLASSLISGADQCPHCDAIFRRSRGVTYHVVRHHDEVRSFLAGRMNPEKRAAEFED